MLTVERYALAQVDRQTIDLPHNWQSLCIMIIANTPYLWVYGDDDAPQEPVEIHCYKDGERLASAPLKYLGSTSAYSGVVVHHFFARNLH